MTTQTSEEYVDIVDEDDQVIGKASWEEMMGKGLLHRTSNVFVFNSKGEIFVHRRATHLRLYPGLWDVKVGGTVRAGETYEEAAKRELMEETGIKNAVLVELFRMKTRRRENPVNRCMFRCVYDGKISLDPDEVAEGRFVKVEEVKKMVKESRMSPSAADVFGEFLRREVK